MKIINVTDEMKAFVAEMAPRDDLGGFSNLKKSDLAKASRLDFQYTGLFGEVAWYVWHYGDTKETYDKLRTLKDRKYDTYVKTGKGDDGEDDTLTLGDGTALLVDVKTTHTNSLAKIPSLNLVIPPRELHDRAFYVAAFTVADENQRRTPKLVALAGWVRTNDVSKRWTIDPNKWAVKVTALFPFTKLGTFIQSPSTFDARV
jgi:hypothetical protein